MEDFRKLVMRKTGIAATLFAVMLAGPVMALPGPLRLAEASIPKKAPIQRTALEYVDQIGTNGLFEIASAKLALEKSKSREVRDFATELLKSYSAESIKLKLALAASSIHASLPQALDNSHNALLDQLKQAKGLEFETRFIQQQMDTHEMILEIHQDFAKRGEDAALKRFATEAEARIDATLDSARKVSHSLSGLEPRA
jgi:putative membrane protein